MQPNRTTRGFAYRPRRFGVPKKIHSKCSFLGTQLGYDTSHPSDGFKVCMESIWTIIFVAEKDRVNAI